MFSLDFWHFIYVFLLWNKIVYEKGTTSRNATRNIYFENSVEHSCVFFYQAEAFNEFYGKLC